MHTTIFPVKMWYACMHTNTTILFTLPDSKIQHGYGYRHEKQSTLGVSNIWYILCGSESWPLAFSEGRSVTCVLLLWQLNIMSGEQKYFGHVKCRSSLERIVMLGRVLPGRWRRGQPGWTWRKRNSDGCARKVNERSSSIHVDMAKKEQWWLCQEGEVEVNQHRCDHRAVK